MVIEKGSLTAKKDLVLNYSYEVIDSKEFSRIYNLRGKTIVDLVYQTIVKETTVNIPRTN